MNIDAAVTSPFPRAIQTADIALGERSIARIIDDDLGDVRIGELEGRTLAEYRASRPHAERSLPFPGGESLNAAARRYARAFTRLLARDERVVLVVTHEIALRYALNAALGDSDLDRPYHRIANATPYVFDDDSLRRAVTRIGELANVHSS